ncbi:MAG: DUF445 domain-containing protein, partial [Gluconacetobacter diazotrophicus]|nr:DUF445 domain-containing protein [Gluconacetobacter diazotrophicus]
ALGTFVATHVFTDADIERALDTLDLPGLLARALRDERVAEAVRGALARGVPAMLAALGDGRAGTLGGRLLPALLHERQVAPLVARALRVLVDGNKHQDVLTFLLGEIRGLLKSREAHLRGLIEERVREQGGRLVGWAIGGSIATRVLGAINAELARTDPRDSQLRDAVTAWMRREIDLIEEDPERARELADTLRGLVTHRSLRSWGGDVWRRVRDAVEADLREPDGAAGRVIDDLLARGVASLETDERTRDAVERQAGALVRRALPAMRARLSGFIGGVVERWDPAGLVDRIELRVGRDLQFVRVNGTIVGALVGGLLFAALRLALGPGAG